MADSVFARIGMIKGESQDDRHKDEIDVLSWSWGVAQASAVAHAGAGGAGRAHFQDFTFTHHVDKASPALMAACVTGRHIKDATITVRKAGEGPGDYLVITMSDVVVASVSTSGTSGGDAPLEAVALAFAKVDLEYTPQKPDGSLEVAVPFKFDLKANATS